MNLIYSDLQQALLEIPTSLHVEVRVFVTSPHVDSSSLSRNTQPRDSETSSTASVTHEGDEKAVWKLQHMPHTTVTSGRPDVEALLTEAASLTMGGSMSVNGQFSSTSVIVHRADTNFFVLVVVSVRPLGSYEPCTPSSSFLRGRAHGRSARRP